MLASISDMEVSERLKKKHSRIIRKKPISQHLQYVVHEGGTLVYDGWGKCLGNFATETEAWEAMQYRFNGI